MKRTLKGMMLAAFLVLPMAAPVSAQAQAYDPVYGGDFDDTYNDGDLYDTYGWDDDFAYETAEPSDDSAYSDRYEYDEDWFSDDDWEIEDDDWWF
jgi:hypothetical protein